MSSWVWPLYRFDPRRTFDGKPPLQLDMGSMEAAAPKTRVEEFMRAETRFRMVEKQDRDRYRDFVKNAQIEADRRRHVYRQLAGVTVDDALDEEVQ